MLTPTFIDHLFFIIVGVYLPLSNLTQSRQGFGDFEFDRESKIQLYYINGMVLWVGAFLALGIWWGYDRSFLDLGFQVPKLNTWTIILSAVFVVLYAFDLYWETQFAERRKKTIAQWKKFTPFMPVNKEELQHFNFLALSAGIAEEIVFRGFFINYGLAFFGNTTIGWFLAVIIPGIVFSLGHIYQGWKAVAKILLLSILFGYIFLWSESLWIVMIFHIGVDLISGRILTDVMAKELSISE